MSLKQYNRQSIDVVAVFLYAFMILVNAGFSGLTDWILTQINALIMLLIFILASLLFLIVHLGRKRLVTMPFFLSIAFSIILTVLVGIKSSYPEYASSKIVLSLLCPFLCGIPLYCRKLGDEAFNYSMLITAVTVVIIGIAYRAAYSFDPEIERYGLFGPIPYGWFCSFGVLAVKKLNWKGVSKTVVATFFMVMLLWTREKGPIVALGVVLFIELFQSNRVGFWKKILILFLMSICIVLGLSLLINTQVQSNNRILAMVIGLLNDSKSYIAGAGAGSIGIRLTSYRLSLESTLIHPLFGIGLGNWKDLAPQLDIIYPHNVLLEILSELGIVGLVSGVLLWWLLYKKTTAGKAYSIYICTALMFSGDITYLRYAIFPLIVDMWRIDPSKRGLLKLARKET